MRLQQLHACCKVARGSRGSLAFFDPGTRTLLAYWSGWPYHLRFVQTTFDNIFAHRAPLMARFVGVSVVPAAELVALDLHTSG